MDLEELTANSFSPHVDEAFRVSGPDAPDFEFTLIEVTEGAEQNVAPPVLARLSRGPSDPQPQRIYRLEHDELGALEVFLVPIGPDAEGQRYEAIFA